MSNEQIFETQEFHQEWRDLIEITGGDINRLRKPLSKPYKKTYHFKKWIDNIKEKDRINLKTVKQMTGNDQINVRKWEELRNRNNINGSQATGHINLSQPVSRNIYYPQSNLNSQSPSIAQQIYNSFGKKMYVPYPHVTLIRPPTEPSDNDDQPPGLEEAEDQDIRLVMAQVRVSREQAIAALRRHDGDIVNAIMDLQY